MQMYKNCNLIYNSHYVTSEKSGLKPLILLSKSYSPKKYEIFISLMLSMTLILMNFSSIEALGNKCQFQCSKAWFFTFYRILI